MARKTILMETAFWDKFSECSRSLNAFADGNDPNIVFEKISRWKEMYDFICHSNVYVDSPLKNLGEKAGNDQMLQALLKKNAGGEFKLEKYKDTFPDLNSNDRFKCDDDYISVFLTAKDNTAAGRMHGVLNICPDNIWNQKEKFTDTGSSVEREKDFSWNRLKILKEASNGMVIVDNFILSPHKKTGKCEISYNLKELLPLLLPDTIYGNYCLSIFYYDDSGDENVRESRRGQFHKSIMDYVGQKKEHLAFELELFPTTHDEGSFQKAFHDRAIITNNVWIGSGAGFDLLKRCQNTNSNNIAIKTTNINGLYWGFSNQRVEWIDAAYDNLIRDAKNALKKFGYTSKNRLLR